MPRFPRQTGALPATATDIGDLTPKQTIYNTLDRPGAVHVYRADCPAGQRVRVQALAPVLQNGRALTPAVAVMAQGLRTGAVDVDLPVTLPAGYTAVALAPPAKLENLQKDWWVGASFFNGPVIDDRTLVGGRCYIVVWSPDKQPGKYVLQVGHVPGQGRLAALWAWWRIRGWFGLSRRMGVAAVIVALLVLWLLFALVTGKSRRRDAAGNGEV